MPNKRLKKIRNEFIKLIFDQRHALSINAKGQVVIMRSELQRLDDDLPNNPNNEQKMTSLLIGGFIWALYTDDEKCGYDLKPYPDETVEKAKKQYWVMQSKHFKLSKTDLNLMQFLLSYRDLNFMQFLGEKVLANLSPLFVSNIFKKKDGTLFPFITQNFAKVDELVTLLLGDQAAQRMYALKNIVRNTMEEYITYNNNIFFSLFHRHGETGRRRAVNFANELLNIQDLPTLKSKIVTYLSDKKNGNEHPHSFRTMLLQSLLKPKSFSLKEVSRDYDTLLNTLKLDFEAESSNWENSQKTEEEFEDNSQKTEAEFEDNSQETEKEFEDNSQETEEEPEDNSQETGNMSPNFRTEGVFANLPIEVEQNIVQFVDKNTKLGLARVNKYAYQTIFTPQAKTLINNLSTLSQKNKLDESDFYTIATGALSVEKDNIIHSELFETAIMQHALELDSELCKIIPSDTDISEEAKYDISGEFIVITYESLSVKQVNAIAKAYQTYYPDINISGTCGIKGMEDDGKEAQLMIDLKTLCLKIFPVIAALRDKPSEKLDVGELPALYRMKC
jgi:hypothetical protein